MRPNESRENRRKEDFQYGGPSSARWESQVFYWTSEALLESHISYSHRLDGY